MHRALLVALFLCLANLPALLAEAGLRAVAAAAPPMLDGVAEAIWELAPEFVVEVHPVDAGLGSLYPDFDPSRRTLGRQVALRAVTHKAHLYLLARWPDATQSIVKKPWLWDADSGNYQLGRGDEDQFALLLPLGEAITDCMATGASFAGDLWHWTAARSQPAGYADDRTLRLGLQNFRGADQWYGRGAATIYGKCFDDPGTAAWQERTDPPAGYQGHSVPRYVPTQPSGSRADIRAGARWHAGNWTLELARALDTGDTRADRRLAPGDSVQVAIAVFDDCGDLYHASSPLFTLSVE